MELRQEPLVDVGHLPHFVNTISTMKRRGNREYTLVGWVDEFLINVFHEIILWPVSTSRTGRLK